MSHVHIFKLEPLEPNKPTVKGVCACGATTKGLSQIEYISGELWPGYVRPKAGTFKSER